MWAIYFLRHAEAAAGAIATARDAARVGRAGYAYAHALMVGGAIVLAVAIELTIAHPSAPLSTADAVVMLAGPAIFLTGNALFIHSVTGSPARIPVAGIAALALLGPVALANDRLALGGAATVVLLALGALVLRAPPQRPRLASH